MTLKDLMKKIEQLNKINSELGIDRSYYLVTSDKYCSKVIYLYNKKDLKEITNYFIPQIATILLYTPVKFVERYLYKIEFINGSNEILEYNIRIGVK